MFEVYVDIADIDFGSVIASVMDKTIIAKPLATAMKWVGGIGTAAKNKAKEIMPKTTEAITDTVENKKSGFILSAISDLEGAIIERVNAQIKEKALGITIGGIKLNKNGDGTYLLHLSITKVDYEMLLMTEYPMILEKVSQRLTDGMEAQLFELIKEIKPEVFARFIKDIPDDTRDKIALLLIESNTDLILEVIKDEAEKQNIKVSVSGIRVTRSGEKLFIEK
jgi:hypothetical protein